MSETLGLMGITTWKVWVWNWPHGSETSLTPSKHVWTPYAQGSYQTDVAIQGTYHYGLLSLIQQLAGQGAIILLVIAI